MKRLDNLFDRDNKGAHWTSTMYNEYIDKFNRIYKIKSIFKLNVSDYTLILKL